MTDLELLDELILMVSQHVPPSLRRNVVLEKLRDKGLRAIQPPSKSCPTCPKCNEELICPQCADLDITHDITVRLNGEIIYSEY